MLFKTLIMAFFLLASCTPVNKEQLTKLMKENPEILTETIKANPKQFMDAVQEAVKNVQEDMRKQQEEEEAKKMQAYYETPLEPEIRDDELFRGSKDGVITLVEYSDFECPFCTRGFNTVTQLLEKYEGKIRFVYKHLPLSFHQNAMIAAQYYEAIRLQSGDKAIKFHDELFNNQQKLKNGEGYLKSVAKKLGANMTKLAKDVSSEKVKARIEADMEEASKFGFRGTPGFLLNGIPLNGAVPVSEFEKVISTLKSKGKLNI